MISVADYKVLRDAPFDLDEGGRKELTFDVPADQLAAQPLIVSYQARPLSLSLNGDDFVEVSVSIAFQKEIDRLRLRENTVHGLWEVFSENLTSDTLKEGVVFKSHHGRVRISDVIVWFQRKI